MRNIQQEVLIATQEETGKLRETLGRYQEETDRLEKTLGETQNAADGLEKELVEKQKEADGLQETLLRQRGETAHLQEEIGKTYASWTYRIGRAITWLPRKMRDGVRRIKEKSQQNHITR